MAYMSFKDKQEIYLFNCKRRQILLEEALKQETSEKRLQFVADYFLNRLSDKQTAKIDNVDSKNIVPFKHDYSFLEDYGSDLIRKNEERKWGGYNFGFTLPQADVDNRGTEKIKVFPTTYSLKMGTCIMFASELQRFAHDFGVSGKIVQVFDYCYDNFDGFSTDNKKINTDRLIKMKHFYNVFMIDGKEFKLDIAGFLTAEDFNRKHPELKIDLNEFYFSENIENNPFSKLAVNNNVQEFISLSQVQPE